MPTIIGANDQGQAKSLADAFANVASQTWGQGAQQAALRGAQTQEALQNAYKTSDANRRMTDYYNYLMAHGVDPTDAHGRALAAFQGPDAVKAQAASNLFGVAATGGPDDITRAQLGTGMQSEGTVRGYNDKLAVDRRGQDITASTATRGQDINAQTQRDVAGIQGQNTIAAERAKQESEAVTVIDPATRQPVLMSRRDAIARGATPIQSLDQTKAGMLQGYLNGQQPGQQPAQQPLPAPSFDGTALPTPPGLMGGQSFASPQQAPNGNNLLNTVDRPQPPAMSKPDGLQPNLMLGPNAPVGIQEIAGEKATNIPMVEPGGARRQGVSRDGGQTVSLTDGTTVPAQGFLPAGPESALNQGRFNNILAGDQPWLARNANADPAKSGAMQAILKLGGPGQLVGNEVNRILGATGLSKILTPMINKDVSAAQQNLEVWNEQMIRGLGISSQPGVKEQSRIAKTMLLDTGFFQNPAQEGMKIPALANALVQRNDVLHKRLQAIPDPSSPAVAQIQQDIAENEKALDMLTDPNWGSKPFDVTNSSTNATEMNAGRTGNNPDGTPKPAMPTATGPNGEKVQWNGQAWVPLNGR